MKSHSVNGKQPKYKYLSPNRGEIRLFFNNQGKELSRLAKKGLFSHRFLCINVKWGKSVLGKSARTKNEKKVVMLNASKNKNSFPFLKDPYVLRKGNGWVNSKIQKITEHNFSIF
jgi:hypothetical protein